MITHATRLGALSSISIMLTLASAMAGETKHGHDWYCPDPKGHAQYEQHRQKYHDHNADEVVLLVDAVYADQSLTSAQRSEKVKGLLEDYSQCR
jgi:hypothetical protein